jgi:hypothetical protein
MKFKGFRVFELAARFFRRVRQLKLPRHLKDQMERAAASVALNAGEGYGRRTWPDKRRFYQMALGSMRESCLPSRRGRGDLGAGGCARPAAVGPGRPPGGEPLPAVHASWMKRMASPTPARRQLRGCQTGLEAESFRPSLPSAAWS